MKQYDITGMSCAACSARVEKAVSGVKGVSSCSVSLLTNSMGVEGNASDNDIINAVRNAGYGASVKGEKSTSTDIDPLKDTETPTMAKRLVASLIFLIILMYISMGHMMFGAPLPSFMNDNPLIIGIAQMMLSAIVMIINQKFFINGFRGIIHRSPNMDTLVAMGSGASFTYSTWALFAMANAQVKSGIEAATEYLHEFYFESAAMILTLITVGKILETRSKGKTTDALKGLMKLSPRTALLLTDGTETEVPVEKVKKDDIFIVKPGASIPVDGIIIEGESAVNDSALTGESIPVDKRKGDEVTSATLNMEGYIKCRATRVGEDTTLSQIIKMVSDAAATKAPIAKIADKVSGIFVPAVIAIAVITLIIWLILGKTPGFSIARAISVLVISCPCALGLATPVAIMVGNGTGARNGILFKTAESLEQTGKICIVALDKTGTITKGEPSVTDIITSEDTDEKKLLSTAYSLERKSDHPLAKAIVSYCKDNSVEYININGFKSITGNGLEGKVDESSVYGGSFSYISNICEVPETLSASSEKLSSEGKTPLFFAENRKLLGLIAVADTIKDDSREAVQQLRDMGIHVVMLTGDNNRTAESIGRQAGVDEVIAGVLPDGKDNVIRSLKKKGKTAMVGDGINDAPALTSADTGIAIGAGADIAVDAADVVLMKSSLADVPAAIRLSRATLRNIHQNLFWAFIYNIIGIPLAAGVYGLHLNPMFGAAAMSLSSFFVVSNALRLNFFKLYDSSKDKKRKALLNENAKADIQKTVIVKGMMCSHCEARVKKALEELYGIDEAVANHEKGTVILSLSDEVTDKDIKKAVKEAGYKFINIK